ncbi:hypothetical protein [Acidianus brierleyi]|uniref:Uncharacterized protein n=1 Tax=Acidianus brierleyi TaxID=41673 RepID=A0A2U9ID92_9CREN|nr:hypothetical protein [Acidianus brierleyi]AWR94003.1 hypothetical protein DFR85_04615 [Acidianus brierleyi]
MEIWELAAYDIENKKAKPIIFTLFSNKLSKWSERKLHNKLVSIFYKPSDYLRMLDYLTYYKLAHNIELDHYPYYRNQVDESICVYSLTLLSLYFPKILSIKTDICPILKDAEIISREEKWILDFMNDEIEDIGYDNAHLELLILLDIIKRIKNVRPDYFLGLWLNSNVNSQDRANLENEIIRKYNYLANRNTKKYVKRVINLIISFDNIINYIKGK